MAVIVNMMESKMLIFQTAATIAAKELKRVLYTVATKSHGKPKQKE